MNCPHCGKVIGREIEETSGKNDIAVGDVILKKSMMVITSNGKVEMKCPGCSEMIPFGVVAAVKVSYGAGKIEE